MVESIEDWDKTYRKRGAQLPNFKTLSQISVPEEVHRKLWDFKKANKTKYSSISSVVAEILEDWCNRNAGDLNYALKTEIDTTNHRIEKLELKMQYLQLQLEQTAEERMKAETYNLSDLLSMSWPKLKVFALGYGVTATNHGEAIAKLDEKITIVRDVDELTDAKCARCGKDDHENGACLVVEEAVFCLYCGDRGHEEKDCEQKQHDDDFTEQRPPTPCEKCGGFHKSKCKMG